MISQAWQHQLSYFSSLPGYSTLVFDNRGVGHSDSPKGAYKTSEMAKDIVELLQEVGWIKEGEEGVEANLNVVGVSMGGMIALELVSLVSLCQRSFPSLSRMFKADIHAFG